MLQVDQALAEAMQIRGALGVAIVDYVSRVTLGARGGGASLIC